MEATTADTPNASTEKQWIRGVNLGGWFLAERFITPYLFAINTCHLEGDLCWYPGQVGAPSDGTKDGANVNWCDPNKCQPVRTVKFTEGNADYHPKNGKPYMDYPIDEYTIGEAFGNGHKNDRRDVARKYMERHWDTFVTYQDLQELKEAGVTHLRVPLSYWIRGDVRDGEPWIDGGWPYLVRAAKWCREIGLTMWIDLHAAPGSQNGFDNSGKYSYANSCKGWSGSKSNVQRTIDVVTDISQGIVDDGLTDVVKGFGVMNEPFLDCDPKVLRTYYDDALTVVRSIMGHDTAVFIGDMFQVWNFNDGFWTDPDLYSNTFLDSHPYQVFFERGRAFTPRQHIAYVCQHNHLVATSCCYDDHPNNTIPSKGISRIMGEWSGAYDALPTAMAPYIMREIAATGVAPLLNRTLSPARQEFLLNFVQAQMVAYESKDSGVGSGWLFWNFKMEGGAFAEWDFIRGVREGWIPKIPDPTVASQDVFGTCLDVYNRTNNDYDLIVDEYPNPETSLDWNLNQGWIATDDFVLSDHSHAPFIPTHESWWMRHPNASTLLSIALAMLASCFVYIVCRGGLLLRFRRREGYEEVK